jgi:type VI protein secretion system component VasK
MTLLAETGGTWPIWLTAICFLLLVMIVVSLFTLALRKFARTHHEDNREDARAQKAVMQNPSAFMAASMEAVIRKLKEQERELERLH